MKKELLSPVGSMEALKMAIHYGADAVYLGGKKFGARAFAANFSNEEMIEAIFLCHLYGVKIYVTVNTMIYESELDEVVSYIQFLYEHHVDAIIMADIGLMKICHEKFPTLEIHASTQVHTHNREQIAVLKDLGIKRVVLARELSLEEIKKFPEDIEIEVFIHGALCISYSGQCLFSSLLMNRSGNRGECAQICRLPFQLLKNGQVVQTEGNYLLSTKDLNTSPQFPELMNSNIKSFKIEGRMKSPAYVGFMTSFYRSLIDRYESNESMEVSDEDLKKAATLFGRGFTLGKLLKQQNQKFMNQITSNHQGSYLGDIEALSFKKIGIRLKNDLHQEDGIRFVSENKGMIVNFLYNERDLLISKAKKGELVFVDNKIGLTKKGRVMKTLDKVLEESIQNYEEKKIGITMSLQIALAFICLKISDGVHEVEVHDSCVASSKNCPLTKEQVIKQFSKLGNTPFVLRKIDCNLEENVYMNVRDMNEIRRKGIEKLIQKRVERENPVICSMKEEHFRYDEHLEITASAWNQEQIDALVACGVSKIYVMKEELYHQNLESGVIYRTNRVQSRTRYPKANPILLGESGGLFQSSAIKYLDYFFNIANHASADYFVKHGVKQICLTPEITDLELSNLLQYYPQGNPFEMIVYGRLEVMILNHCIVSMNVSHDKICKACQEKDSFSLQDSHGNVYPLWMDESHRTHIFHGEIRDDILKIKAYYQMGIRKFRLEFYEETPNEIIEVVNQVKQELCITC